MNEMMLDGTMRKAAGYLAGEAKFDLTDHTPEQYDMLLRAVAQLGGGIANSIDFKNLARQICTRFHGSGRPETRKLMATNALAICHLLGKRVGDLEDEVEMRGGLLAKIKGGAPVELTPVNIVNLASALGVPISLLRDDFANQPEELKRRLVACGALKLGEVQSVVEPTAPVAVTRPAEVIQPVPPPVIAAVAPPVVAVVEEDSPPEPAPPVTVAKPALLTMAEVAGNIRHLAKQQKLSLTNLLSIIGINNRRHLENVEKGDATFSQEELEKVAVKLGVEVGVLTSVVTFSAAQRPKGAETAKALVPVGAKKLPLPPLTDEFRQNYFRGRCLRKGVEMAEGHHVDELLAAAGSVEPVDWCLLWRDSTKEGESYRRNLEAVSKMFRPWGDVLKSQFLEELHTAMWPEET